MTINNRMCKQFNTCRKSFIKCCDPYSVTGFTSTSHTGCYKQHEPVNKLYKAGWSHSTLFPTLGSVDPRPVGSTDCGWLPTRFTKEITSVPGTKHDKNHSGELKLVTLEVTELLSKGAVVETQLTPHSFVSQVFLVEKKDGGQRPVINLKGLNQFVRVEHFKMEGLPDLLQSGDWMVKMDIKDAYLQVPINPCHQPLLSFQWEEKYYMFTCLPFGLSAAPRVFTKLLKPVVGLLRQLGCRLTIYLDDLLILHQHKDRLQQMVQLIGQLFSSLGLIVNHKKSILLPTQILEFLGFNINSQSMQISLPQEKMRKIQQDSNRLLAQQSVSVRQIAQFVGKATATL